MGVTWCGAIYKVVQSALANVAHPRFSVSIRRREVADALTKNAARSAASNRLCAFMEGIQSGSFWDC